MRLTDITTICITDSRPDFDKACADIYRIAADVFGITVDGCCTKVKDFKRYIDSIHIKFISYERIVSVAGHEHTYTFETWIERDGEE